MSKKNEMSKNNSNLHIEPKTARILANLPYGHLDFYNFGLAYKVLGVSDLTITKYIKNSLKNIAEKFKQDYIDLCNALDLDTGNGKNKEEALYNAIFNSIEEWNDNVPDLLQKQTTEILDRKISKIKWDDFFEKSFETGLMGPKKREGKLGLKSKSGEKIPYAKMILNEDNMIVNAFGAEQQKTAMRKIVSILEKKGYLKAAGIPTYKAKQIFQGQANTVAGLLLFSKAYRRLMGDKNLKSTYEQDFQTFYNGIEANVIKNFKLQSQILGQNAEEQLKTQLSKLKPKNSQDIISVEVQGASASQNKKYQGTNKIDVLLRIGEKAFGISSKNMKNDEGDLLGVFHQAANNATLLNFLNSSKGGTFITNGIQLSRLLIYLFANYPLKGENPGVNKNEIKTNINNLIKLFLYEIIGQEIVTELKNEQKTNDVVRNILIIDVPNRKIIPTYKILEQVANNFGGGNNSKLKDLSSSKEPELFKVSIKYEDNNDDKTYSKEQKEKRENLAREMVSIKDQMGELKYNDKNLLSLGRQYALAEHVGKHIAIKIAFLEQNI